MGGRSVILLLDIPMEPNDQAYIEQLYAKYGKIMFYAALGKLNQNHQDAEDAVHDGVLKLCRHVATLKTLKSNKLKRYIVYTAENAAKDLIRARRYDSNAGEAPLPYLPDQRPSVEEQAMSNINLEKLTDRIAGLPDKHREILYLHDIVGWKVPDIAKKMGLAPATIRVYLGEARRMAGLMNGKGVDENENKR